MQVVIGAGPAGLYTAIKLRQAGIKDVVVYDPRAGDYTRPGHLDEKVFRRAEDGINKQFWNKRVGHIKDIEKKLYEEAIKLSIKIEKKSFIGLHQDAKNPGVIVRTSESDEIIPADYVFDCTGSRRTVVFAVNTLEPESPFKLKPITDIPVHNHFIAYIKMDEQILDQILAARANENLNNIKDPLAYARSIVKLRELDWHALKLPYCYGVTFGKGKVCMYLHAPEHLTKENQEQWVRTVMESYTTPISYQHVSLSKTYESKPRFTPFTVNAEYLEPVSYKGENLPVVIGLGDAQIDPDFTLGHGIYNGIERIDALFNTMDIINGKICYFNAEDYQVEITALIQVHKEEVTETAIKRKQEFDDSLSKAELLFQSAIKDTTDQQEAFVFNEILTEIKARQSYLNTCKTFAKYHNENHLIKLAEYKIDTLRSKLPEIHEGLLKALNDLPPFLTAERTNAENLLAALANSWKEIGNQLFKQGKYIESTNAYKEALEIYASSDLMKKYPLKGFAIYSNMAIAYNKEKAYFEAISIAQNGLDIYENFDNKIGLESIYEKLVFNLIKATIDEAKNALFRNEQSQADLSYKIAENLFSKYKHGLSQSTSFQTEKLIKELETKLNDKTGEKLKTFGVFSERKKDENLKDIKEVTPSFG